MGHKVIEYVDTSQLYATNYVRNSKAIAVLWAIFTICYSIIVVVSFVTPGECARRLLTRTMANATTTRCQFSLQNGSVTWNQRLVAALACGKCAREMR